MRTLYFDTETTGLANFKGKLEDQPQPVQLACMLKEEGRVYAVCSLIVNAGVPVPPPAQAVHGIGDDALRDYGIGLEDATVLFMSLVAQADRIAAHNSDFDRLIMAAAILRVIGKEDTREFISFPHVCTMHSATPVLKLPGKYGYKWPTLMEAYKHFVDPEGFEGAHDALADVKACAAILEAMEAQGLPLVGGKY